LFDDTPGPFAPVVVEAGNQGIPVVGISEDDGLLIRDRLGAGPVDITWTDGVVHEPTSTGRGISDFSSYGLSPDLSLKPDLAAPGGWVRSTYPLEAGAYAVLSGTSMSSPHVAGACALLLQAKPRTPAQAVRSLLQNNADPERTFDPQGPFGPPPVIHQGAGLLQIDAAILATTTIEPAKIAVGESSAGPVTQTLAIKNNGTAAVTYDLSFVNALSVDGVSAPVTFVGPDATVTFSANPLSVAVGGTATVAATINPASFPELGQYGGYIRFTPQGGGKVHHVPFAGFVGSYSSIQVLTGGFPVLARLTGCLPLTGCTFDALNSGATFDLSADINQTPYFRVHLEHQVLELSLERAGPGT
jgi:subtilisin family serine protease